MIESRTTRRLPSIACNWVGATRSLLIVLAVGLVGLAPILAQPTAFEVIERAVEQTQGDSQQGRYTMTIVRPTWERSMTFDFWSEGDEKSFIRIVEPAKERGVAFLKLGREMWNYVPRINRVIKIPPSMMLQSWMGSDFTNDDLVRESSEVDDYTHALLATEAYEEREAYVIELKPKQDTAVAWDRIVEWIDTELYLPLKAEYYNERGEKVRTMLFSDIRTMGGRTVPLRMELVEESRPGHRTILVLNNMTYDRRIPASIFSQQNLRRR